MRGLTVTLWEDGPVQVENVLVGEPGTEDVEVQTGIPGPHQVFTLGIPKGDAHAWTDRRVSWSVPGGEAVTARAFGHAVTGVEQLIPGPWHKKVRCVRIAPGEEQTVTIWSAGKRITAAGAFLTGSSGTERTENGKVGTDAVKLSIPAFAVCRCGTSVVSYCRPKAYAALAPEAQAERFTLDSGAFFALGDIPVSGKFQAVNAAYDDVYRVQSVTVMRTETGAEYLEVTGK